MLTLQRLRSVGNVIDVGPRWFSEAMDEPETIEARLKVYDEQTAPLIPYYQAKHILSDLDGSGEMAGVYGRLSAVLLGLGAQ